MGSFTVRKATKSDIPAIMGLIQVCCVNLVKKELC